MPQYQTPHDPVISILGVLGAAFPDSFQRWEDLVILELREGPVPMSVVVVFVVFLSP